MAAIYGKHYKKALIVPIFLNPIFLKVALRFPPVEPLYNGQEMIFDDSCLLDVNTNDHPSIMNKVNKIVLESKIVDDFLYIIYCNNLFKFCITGSGRIWLGKISKYNYLVDSNNDVFLFSGAFFFKGNPIFLSAPGKVWRLL